MFIGVMRIKLVSLARLWLPWKGVNWVLLITVPCIEPVTKIISNELKEIYVLTKSHTFMYLYDLLPCALIQTGYIFAELRGEYSEQNNHDKLYIQPLNKIMSVYVICKLERAMFDYYNS